MSSFFDNDKKGVAVFLLIAFGLAWILWEITIMIGPSARDPLFQLAILPGALSPAVAAFIVRKWVTREGFSDSGLRLNLTPLALLPRRLDSALAGGHGDRAPSHNSGHKRPRLLPETRNMATRATRNRCPASSRRHLRSRGLPVDDHRPPGNTHPLWRGIRMARLPPTPTPRRSSLSCRRRHRRHMVALAPSR